MSTSTKTSFYADSNNQYALKVQTIKIAVAAKWLRERGAIFSTYSDRSTGMTRFYIKSAPKNVVELLTKKYGFFNAATKSTTAAPAPTTSRTLGKGELTREEWLSRFRSDSALRSDVGKARKIRNALELPRNADALKPIPVVVPQLAVEANCYNKSEVNGVVVVTGTYTCQTVQLDGEGFRKAVPLHSRSQTNADLSGGVAHVTDTAADTPINIMPGYATTELLMGCTLNQLYKLASKNNIQGRSTLKGEKNKAALVAKLVGLVKKSELK